jgi:hypothetical protein
MPRRFPSLLALALACALLAGGCRQRPAEPEGVARVGEAELTTADLERALAAMPPGMDSLTARDQYVEQWVMGQLLAQEARRRGLLDSPDVQRQLADNERNVLAAALLGALYDEEAASFSTADLETYFSRNRDRLRLREPYVRVRFVETTERPAAEAARAELQAVLRAEEPARDSLFALLAERHARQPEASLALSRSLVPQSRLARQAPAVPWTVVAQLSPGDVSAVLPAPDSTFLVVALEERAAAGTLPQLDWIAEEVRRHLAIQNRQQLVAREVQRLRTEAEARGDLRSPATAGL